MPFHHLPRRFLLLFFITVCALLIGSCGARSTPMPKPVLASLAPTTASTPTPKPSSTATRILDLLSTQSAIRAKNATAIAKARTHASTLPTITSSPVFVDTPMPLITTPLARENTPIPHSGTPIRPETASQMVELARWGKGTVNGMAYTPDGEILAVATNLGVYLYNWEQGLVGFIETDQPIQSLTFSPREDILATGSNQGQLQFWNWKEKRLIKTVNADLQQRIQQLTFSPAGDLIGYSIAEAEYPGGQVVILKVADDTPLFHTTVTLPGTFQFAPDGQSIYTASGSIEKYRLADGTVQAHWELPNPDDWEVVNNMALSSDEKMMVVSSNFRVYLWNQKDPAPFYSFEATDDIYNGHWTYKANTCNFSVSGGGDRYFVYTISPDNQRLVVLGGNGYFEIRRLRDGALIATSPEKSKRGYEEIFVNGAVFHPSMPELAVRYSHGPIEIVNLDSMAVQGTINGHTEEYSALAFSPSNLNERAYLAAGASDQITRIWNIQNGQRAMDLDAQALSVAFSSNGKYLAWGSKDWAFTLLNIIDGQKLGPIHAHNDWVSSVVITSDQKTLITGSYDCTIRIWDIREDGADISLQNILGETKESQLYQVTNLVLSRNEVWMLGISSHTVFRYNLKTQQFDGHTEIDGVGVAIAPDSRTFAVGGWNGLSIWNIETLEKVDEWTNVDAGQIAYSPDGRLIAVGTYEGLVALVDSQTGQVLHTLKGHLGEITDLKFSQDGQALASAAKDGTVRIWGIP